MADEFVLCVAEVGIDSNVTGRVGFTTIWFRLTTQELFTGNVESGWNMVTKESMARPERAKSILSCCWIDDLCNLRSRTVIFVVFAAHNIEPPKILPMRGWYLNHPENGFLHSTEGDLYKLMAMSPWGHETPDDRMTFQREWAGYG